MAEAKSATDWYEWACRRARASRRRAGKHSSELPEFAPPIALSDGPLGEIQAADREIGRQTAVRARAVVKFAASRPASADRAQGEPGAMSPERWAARPESLRGVSEWAAQELVVALSISSEAAEALLAGSLTLVHRLPGTLAALEAGALHPGHLWTMQEKVAPIEDPTVRAEVEAGLLRWAAGRVTTPAQLGAKARREVARRDARAAARQLEKAIRRRGVHLRPDATDGMAVVTALLTLPEARLLVKALEAYADAVPDDPENPRTRAQKMADCLLDLVLRPGETDVPSVQLVLTVVASLTTMAGGDEPGEIDGHVVPAEMVREVIRLFGPEPPPDARAPDDDEGPAAGRAAETADGTEPADDAAGPAWQQVEQEELERWWEELERRVLSGELGTGPEPLPEEDTPVGLSRTADEAPGDFFEDCFEQDFFEHEYVEHEDVEHGPPDQQPAAGPPGREPADMDDGAPDGHGRSRPPGEAGWWADADRAVDEASHALRGVDQALSRAGRLVRTALNKDAADEADWQETQGRFNAAGDAVAVLRACTVAQREWLADLLSTTGGGGLAERPRLALTDAVSGALLAVTDLPEMRRVASCGGRACRRNPARCSHDLTGKPGLGPPGPTAGYRPSAPLDRWVRARDRRCRFPGCRRRVPRGGELDHDQPYPHGPTSATNLAGYCTGHHRGKHQAPGWRHALAPDGTLTVTTPTGLTAVTTPPPY